MEFYLNDINDMKKLSKIITYILKPEIYLLLNGNLATGKTTFAKFLIKNLQIKENITSPTFVIMNKYKKNDIYINHMDCYRLNKSEDFSMYLEEFENSINIIEWPKILKKYLKNKNIIEIFIKKINQNKRKCILNFNYEINDKIKIKLNKFIKEREVKN